MPPCYLLPLVFCFPVFLFFYGICRGCAYMEARGELMGLGFCTQAMPSGIRATFRRKYEALAWALQFGRRQPPAAFS